jgi:hypothetical protein
MAYAVLYDWQIALFSLEYDDGVNFDITSQAKIGKALSRSAVYIRPNAVGR